jgi:uncharacterized repeat protein (TIGR01451 family)
VTLAPGDLNLTIDAGIYIEVQPPQLILAKRSEPASGISVTTNALITYTVVLTNVGGSAATNVVVTDSIPAGTAYVAGSATPAPTSGPDPLVWTFATVNPGETKSVRFTVRVLEGSDPSTIINTAIISSTETPPTTSNEVLNPRGPTAVTLASFNATLEPNGGAKISWRTTLERDTWGFYVLRSVTGKRSDAVKVNADLVVAQGANGGGASYSVVDREGSVSASYWLQEIELSGAQLEYGPVKVATAGQPGGNAQTGASVIPAGAVPGGVPIAVVASTANTTGNTTGNTAPAPAVAPTAAPPAPVAPVAQTIASRNDAANVVAPAANVQAQPAATSVPQAEVVPAAAQPTEPAQQAVAASSEIRTQAAQVAANPLEAVGAVNAVNVVRGNSQTRAAELRSQPASNTSNAMSMLPLIVLGVSVLLAALSATGIVVFRRRRTQDTTR